MAGTVMYPYEVKAIDGPKNGSVLLKNQKQFESRIAFLERLGYTLVGKTEYSAKLEW